jgi:hypothetical protein
VTDAWTQLRALVSLRWQMTRTPGVKSVLLLLPFLVVWFLYVVAASAPELDRFQLAGALEVAPAAYLGFAVLAVIAPLTAGGGNELVPAAQLVAFPVRPQTQFLGGLLLAPINLVWVVQILVLAAETCYLTLDGHRATGIVTTVAYIACLTVFGQAVAWIVVGLRQTRGGRGVVNVVTGVIVAAVVLIVRLGYGDEALHMSPTRTVVHAVSGGPGVRWSLTTLGLALGTVAAVVVGARACGWALTRPADASVLTPTTSVRRRPARRTALTELIATDRSSVWRAVALRRAGLVLAIMPSVVALGAAVPWASLVVLPGLVAAGAGRRLGVNA